jgi:hypothetical protein
LDELSELIEGAYSCFKGEDVLLLLVFSDAIGVAFSSGI